RVVTGAVAALTVALSLPACSGSSSKNGSPATGGGVATTGSTTSAGPTDLGAARPNIECDKTPDTCNAGTATKGGKFAYTIEKDIQDWDLLTNAGNTFDTQEALDAIYPNVFEPQPDLSYKLASDYFLSAEETSTGPQTIVYTINPEAVWNDGTPLNADDLILTWNLQSSKACGGAAADAPASSPTFCDPASTSGYDQIKSLTSSNNGETATLVFATPYSDWRSLFGPIMPAHIAAKNGGGPHGTGTREQLSAVTTYFSKTVPTWSAGPYLIKNFEKNTAVTEVPNPRWAGARGPYFDTLVFRILTDATAEPPALANGEVQAINPQPEVDLVKSIQSQKGVIYHVGAGLLWEHFDFNLLNKALQDKAVRLAMFTALSRESLIKRTIGQFDPNVKTLDNHMFVPGQTGYTDNAPAGLGSGDVAAATRLLSDAGYKLSGGKLKLKDGADFPTLTARYTVGNSIRQNELGELARDVAKIGITLKVMSTDDLGATLTHTAGKDYDVVVFAWQGTPAVYQSAQQTWQSTSGSNFGRYKNPAVDALLNKAVSETDPAKANAELNQADKLLSADAYVMPLYQKPTFLAFKQGVVNVRDNATSVGPPYNVSEWGFGTLTAR
ncbi:MAG: glutathione transport system substrate-binding protein, partial [Frankiales bacterium]|nr:glutathione transport system substrate-binding protein [Frankiales bacterium]